MFPTYFLFLAKTAPKLNLFSFQRDHFPFFLRTQFCAVWNEYKMKFFTHFTLHKNRLFQGWQRCICLLDYWLAKLWLYICCSCNKDHMKTKSFICNTFLKFLVYLIQPTCQLQCVCCLTLPKIIHGTAILSNNYGTADDCSQLRKK